VPKFLEPAVLAQAKLRVNEQYRPVVSVAELAAKKAETPKACYKRVSGVLRKLLENHPSAPVLLLRLEG